MDFWDDAALRPDLPMNATTDQQNLSLEHLLHVIRRRWWIVVVCTLLTGGAAVFFSVIQRKQYTASASLLFRNPGFDQMVFGSTFFAPQTDPARQAATNIDLVSLPRVAARTARALGGRLTLGQVSAEVSVSAAGQADVASVSATDPSPSRAAQIANAYARQYILFRREADRSKIGGAQTQIQHELAALTPQQRASTVGQSLVNRANQLQTLAALQTGNAELVQPATVPGSPSSPKTKRNGIIGALLGLMLGLGLVFLVDRFDRRLRDLAAIEDAYGAPILGAVPYSSAFRLAPRTDLLPPAEAEVFGLLRARLRYFNVDRDLRSLLITSAMPDDGKTTIGLNLAIAEAGSAQVVLVEADLRRPTLARRLDILSGPGLAEVLSRNVTLEKALQRVPMPGRSNGSGPSVEFSVLVAGAIPPNPAELIESHSMTNLLTTLSERFELVIIDSPPVSVVSDAIPLMRQVSGVVVVSRIGKTSRDAARHLREQLHKLSAPTLGVVANGVSAKGGGYYGYVYSQAYEDRTADLPKSGAQSAADAEPAAKS